MKNKNMGLFDKSLLEQLLSGTHTTRQRNMYARSSSVEFIKWFLMKNITNVSRTNPITVYIDGEYLTIDELYDKFIQEEIYKNGQQIYRRRM